MRWLRSVLVTLLALAGVAAIAMAVLAVVGGFTARAKASRVEGVVAKLVRDLATPRSAKAKQNPVKATAEALARARRHFAAECASCHGNDGRGSQLGKRLFPSVPDLRETRDLAEGEIFSIVEDGIRWSGMPAFGDPGDADEANAHWEVVHFIRHLPDLSAREIEEMKRFNPRPPQPGGKGAATVDEDHAHGAPAAAEPTKRSKPKRRDRRAR